MQVRAICFVVATAFSGPVLALASMPPPKDGPILFVVPPWLDRAVFLQRLGARELGPAPAPMAILAVLDDTEQAGMSKEYGAWAVLDGAAVARICGFD